MQAEAHLPGAEEYITVFTGAVAITVASERFSLNAGDSLRFQADAPHCYENIGTGDAVLSMLIFYGV